MSGNSRFILDTNAIVSLLAGNHRLAEQLDDADYVGISVISYLEFLAFDGLTAGDRASFEEFCAKVEVVALAHDNTTLTSLALELRSRHRLKLPDAIIGATALYRKALLITNDSHFDGIDRFDIQGC